MVTFPRGWTNIAHYRSSGGPMTETNDVPATAEEFRALVLAHYDGLSRRLQQIARYVLDHPNEVALETLAVIAQRADVQPSAIVRFAKGFGFAGASQMQRLFRDGLLSENAELRSEERRVGQEGGRTCRSRGA